MAMHRAWHWSASTEQHLTISAGAKHTTLDGVCGKGADDRSKMKSKSKLPHSFARSWCSESSSDDSVVVPSGVLIRLTPSPPSEPRAVPVPVSVVAMAG